LSVERIAEMEEFWALMEKRAVLSGLEKWRNPETAIGQLVCLVVAGIRFFGSGACIFFLHIDLQPTISITQG
jgi:tRNA-binding EMAP/Myf-like protein